LNITIITKMILLNLFIKQLFHYILVNIMVLILLNFHIDIRIFNMDIIMQKPEQKKLYIRLK